MESDVYLRTYHVKHRNIYLDELLNKAKKVADYAVSNKKKFFSSKDVKHIGLPSTISNQILRKYGRGTIKHATNVNIVVPNSSKNAVKLKDGTLREYRNIEYRNGIVYVKPLKLQFRWNPGKDFEKINQIEIDEHKYMLCVTFRNNHIPEESTGVLGIDLNCGVGRHVAVCANLQTNEVLCLGKQGPNIRLKYFKKRQNQIVKGNKLHRIMKDQDHKMSRKIVNYALQNKLRIVVEDLKGIRFGARKGNGSRVGNRFVNSWSFYRLQSFIEYKCKEHNIPYIKIKPHYTSQECSYCHVIGSRDGKYFVCNNTHCRAYSVKRHSDVNAPFNIGQRSFVPSAITFDSRLV